MAKKRGRKKNAKEVTPEHKLPGGFWRQVFAVILIAIAVICVVTWFGHGGNILNEAHRYVQIGIGFGAYVVPVLLVYLAVKIFRAEDNRIATAIWIASCLMVVWISGIAGISNNGGVVGKWLCEIATQFLDSNVVVFIYIILIFITALFILQLSPITFAKGTKNSVQHLVKHDKANGNNVADNDMRRGGHKKLGDLEIKVNSGVTMESESAPRSTIKTNSMKATAPVEEKALVAVSDPDWKMPSIDLLEKKQSPADAGNVQQNAYIIQSTLAEFGIEVEMGTANVGPRVTQYTMRPPAGVNLSKILARDKELALNLAVDKIRIEAPIPGTSSVGVEIPNTRSADVRLRGVLESNEWKRTDDPLVFAVGKDISGKPVVANLAKMPHLLIAGTTGSGKSVMTNTLITSLLYRNAPSDMKLIIIDPKQVEMAQYNDIPHLLSPIITSVDKSLSAMSWAVNEMERRYTLMAEDKVKNIVDYNKKISSNSNNAEPNKNSKMPYIVIIVDEMADLMMMAGKDLEMLIVRIAQKGRAAGIHLVLATQRPEVKVITGLIKANIPGRIAFAVGSQIDSRIMLDQGGAEKLLGKGDMLLLTTEMMGKPRRIQGAWASDEDVAKVTDYLREQAPPSYNDEVISQQVSSKLGPSGGGSLGEFGRKYDPNDPVVRRAIEISLQSGKFSTSNLQTYLGKGHGFVSGLGIWLEEMGIISPANGNKPRELFISSLEEFDEKVAEHLG